jgi:PBSX family phage terminase large subunit
MSDGVLKSGPPSPRIMMQPVKRRPAITTKEPFQPDRGIKDPWQKKALNDCSKVLLLTGSAGGGKSRVAREKVHAFCHRYPGARALVIRESKGALQISVIRPMLEDTIGDDPRCTYRKQDGVIEYANGSQISFHGVHQEDDAQRLRSVEADLIWVEEANKISEDDFTEVLRCLRGKAAPWRQIILSTNPDAPNHWIKRRMIDGGEASVYYSGASDNANNPSDYLETLEVMTGLKRQRLKEGRWVQAEGVVYEEYDPETHLQDAFPIPAHWRRYIAIDFGHTKPFTAQWWAEDGDGRLYLYRELYRVGTLADENARRLRELSGGERFSMCVCDSEDPGSISIIRRDFYSDARPARKYAGSVEIGIDQVKARMRVCGDGKPRMLIFKNALVERDRKLQAMGQPTCLIDELAQYRYKPDTHSAFHAEDKFEGEDHGCDAMRYLVMAQEDARAMTYDRIVGVPNV